MNEALHRTEEIFSAALEFPDSAGRNIFLDRECAGDARLRAEVERLLSLRVPAEQFFARTELGLNQPAPGTSGTDN